MASDAAVRAVSPVALQLLHASNFVRLFTNQTVDLPHERVLAAMHRLIDMLDGRTVTVTPEMGGKIADLLSQLAIQVITDDVSGATP